MFFFQSHEHACQKYVQVPLPLQRRRFILFPKFGGLSTEPVNRKKSLGWLEVVNGHVFYTILSV